MAENEAVLEELSRDELIAQIVALKADLATARSTVSRQATTINNLQEQARRYYRAASDYVPPVEREDF